MNISLVGRSTEIINNSKSYVATNIENTFPFAVTISLPVNILKYPNDIV